MRVHGMSLGKSPSIASEIARHAADRSHWDLASMEARAAIEVAEPRSVRRAQLPGCIRRRLESSANEGEPVANGVKARALGLPTSYLAMLAILPLYLLYVFVPRPDVFSVAMIALVMGFLVAGSIGFRLGVLVVLPVGVLASVFVALSQKPLPAALCMGVAAVLARSTSVKGDVQAVSLPLFFLSIWLLTPPLAAGTVATGWANVALVGVLVAVGGLWGCGIGGVVHVRRPMPIGPALSRSKALVLGVLTGLAFAGGTYVSMHHHLAEGGSWFLLTVLIVFQPFSTHPWSKTIHRLIGTLLGFAIVYALTFLLPADARSMAFVLPGLAALGVAAQLIQDPTQPYWKYVVFWTSGLLLIVGGTSGARGLDHEIRHVDLLRLGATTAGALVAIGMTALVMVGASVLRVERTGEEEDHGTGEPTKGSPLTAH